MFGLLVVEGRPENTHTMISHGVDKYGPGLLSQIRRQLRFPTAESFLDSVECRMGYDDDVRLLREAGEIEARS